MVQEPSSDTGANLPKARPGQDRLESLVISLIELKSNITRVEDQHPVLGNDLSALCDLVILHLERPDDSLQNKPGPAEETPKPADHQFTPEIRVQVISESVAVSPPCLQTAARQGTDGGTREKGNRLASIFDRAGDHLVSGLDKMGDGIIFVLEKLISVGSRDKTEASEEATPTEQ
jgi:hypothetical protein